MSESSKDYDAVVDIVSSTSVVQRRKSSSRRPSRDIDFAKQVFVKSYSLLITLPERLIFSELLASQQKL